MEKLTIGDEKNVDDNNTRDANQGSKPFHQKKNLN